MITPSDSSKEFIWYIEKWDIVRPTEPELGAHPVSFTNKKIYPAKVTRINIPLPNFLNINSDSNLPVTVK